MTTLRQRLADAEAQIVKLATFIMANVPGEPSESQGAVDTAIRVMTTLQARVRELEEALAPVLDKIESVSGLLDAGVSDDVALITLTFGDARHVRAALARRTT